MKWNLTIIHAKGKKIVIGHNVNFIIKQASHQNLGVVFMGQNANVSKYPVCTILTGIARLTFILESNCYDAISNSNQFTAEQQNKLKAIATTTAYCESKNSELGLRHCPDQKLTALALWWNRVRNHIFLLICQVLEVINLTKIYCWECLVGSIPRLYPHLPQRR